MPSSPNLPPAEPLEPLPAPAPRDPAAETQDEDDEDGGETVITPLDSLVPPDEAEDVTTPVSNELPAED